jgi:hypothetical protein
LSAPPPGSAHDRDRRIVRRALLAGAVATALTAAPLAAGLRGRGPAAVAAALWIGLAVGGVTAAGWLLLALGLDVLGRVRPTRRRLVWTALVSGAALVLPLLALTALSLVGEGG